MQSLSLVSQLNEIAIEWKLLTQFRKANKTNERREKLETKFAERGLITRLILEYPHTDKLLTRSLPKGNFICKDGSMGTFQNQSWQSFDPKTVQNSIVSTDEVGYTESVDERKPTNEDNAYSYRGRSFSLTSR